MTRIIVFLFLLLINLIVSVVYLIWNRGARRKKNVYICFLVMLLCPVVGPVFLLGAYLIFKLLFDEPVDLEDVIFSKERVKTTVRAEEEKERNMVSLEEAIEITNEKDLRILMMNIVRGDIQKFLHSISQALNSEDTETSHYAASVLQDALNEFREKVEMQRGLVLVNKEGSPVVAEALIEYMNQVLEQRVFTDMEQKKYVGIMDEMCEYLFGEKPELVTSQILESISMRLLEIENYSGCEKWCDRSKAYFPNTLSTYTCQLKLYFTKRDREKFFETVEELKASPVVVDNETLELLRVFR